MCKYYWLKIVSSDMGRTKRLRKKSSRNFRRLDHEPELIALNSWLSQNGTRWNKKLGYADFDNVGRGLITNKSLLSGEMLVDLPLMVTINIATVLLDTSFKELFDGYNKHYKSVSIQALLSLYLLHLKYKSSNSSWNIYIHSLPKEYTVPYFLSDNAKNNLESSIRAIVQRQENDLKSSYAIFNDILSNAKEKTDGIQLLCENFSKTNYEWAYFTVNTRCVYMDLSDIIDFSQIDSPILRLMKENLTIALCPYLDMINHSSGVKTETRLIVTSSFKQMREISQNALSNIRFHLYTMNAVKSYNEVYICYGESHNLKLVTEYGFYLPYNQLDSVNFKFESVKSCLQEQNIKLSNEQCNFISSHGLSSGLYVDVSGLSFNLYALLMVLKFYYNGKNDLSRVIYSNDVGSSRNNLNEIILPLLNEKIKEIYSCLANLSDEVYSVNLDNCVKLMERYIDILKSVKK